MVLSNFEIYDICKELNINLNEIYSKDLIPYKLKKGGYIINLEDSDGHQGGTHWVAMWNDKEKKYFDSFGVICPEEIIKKFKKPIFWSDKKIQHIKSTNCGWFCICFLYCMQHNKDYNEFLNMFSENSLKNDKILNDMIKKISHANLEIK